MNKLHLLYSTRLYFQQKMKLKIQHKGLFLVNQLIVELLNVNWWSMLKNQNITFVNYPKTKQFLNKIWKLMHLIRLQYMSILRLTITVILISIILSLLFEQDIANLQHMGQQVLYYLSRQLTPQWLQITETYRLDTQLRWNSMEAKLT